jgi:hypothetical protein
MPLRVAVPRSGHRVEDDALVEHVTRTPVDHHARQQRHAHRGHRGPDLDVQLRVQEGVDGRGVLRPHHEVGLWGEPRAHVGGEPDGLGRMVMGDFAIVRQHLGAAARHVALHRRHLDARRRLGGVRRNLRRQRHGEEGDQAAERDQAPPPARLVRRGQQRAGQCQQETDPGGAGVGQRSGDRGVDDGVGQTAPGHATRGPV